MNKRLTDNDCNPLGSSKRPVRSDTTVCRCSNDDPIFFEDYAQQWGECLDREMAWIKANFPNSRGYHICSLIGHTGHTFGGTGSTYGLLRCCSCRNVVQEPYEKPLKL